MHSTYTHAQYPNLKFRYNEKNKNKNGFGINVENYVEFRSFGADVHKRTKIWNQRRNKKENNEKTKKHEEKQ